MRLHRIALSGAALLALVSPAFAGQGWYAGLGAGWDTLNNPGITGTYDTGKLKTNDSAIVIGSFGYKWHNWRFEIEPGYTRHDLKAVNLTGGGSVPVNGHATLMSGM